MKTPSRILSIFFAASIIGCLLSSFFKDEKKSEKLKVKFPYKQAGLNERQAAAHLLNRFTYGATPKQVDAVVDMGLEKWFAQQLNAGLADDTLNAMLANYDAINLTNEQVLKTYPRGPQVLREAIKDGVINKDSVNKSDKKAYRGQVLAYMQTKGYKPEQELFRQFINQKILRAAYTNNQMQEIMTDFWFNHFNVSITKNDCAQFIPAYERDVIRPNVFGKFENLLTATAQSPAMLLYLDNFSSSGTNDDFDKKGGQQNPRLQKMLAARMEDEMGKGDSTLYNTMEKRKVQQGKRNGGLNENYAREIMELHTLGVDGGYTQSDVTQAAKVLTGWTLYPIGEYGQIGAMKKMIERVGEDKMEARGFVHHGDFLFAVNRHDNHEKTVLGKKFASGGGYEEGVALLNMLAHHQSTAKFIARKLAVRFTSDNPPQSLIDKLSKTFIEKDGDIREVLIAMVAAPEFWAKESLREKTKSPFEYAISALRGLDADIAQPFQINNWITKMGQKMYFYQAPTGFPDKGQYWINTGSLLNRMNFGLALASKRIPGVTFDLAALNDHHEPESAEAALPIYAKLLLPERDLDATIQRLKPMVNDPDLVKKVDEAASQNSAPMEPTMSMAKTEGSDDVMMMDDNAKERPIKQRINKKNNNKNSYTIAQMQTAFGSNSMLSQVVGVIIGSPEFQRK